MQRERIQAIDQRVVTAGHRAESRHEAPFAGLEQWINIIQHASSFIAGPLSVNRTVRINGAKKIRVYVMLTSQVVANFMRGSLASIPVCLEKR